MLGGARSITSAASHNATAAPTLVKLPTNVGAACSTAHMAESWGTRASGPIISPMEGVKKGGKKYRNAS